MWLLSEVPPMLEGLEAYLRVAGYSVALGGSVLHRGSSTNDMDLLIFPLDSTKRDLPACYRALRAYGLELVADVARVHRVVAAEGELGREARGSVGV